MKIQDSASTTTGMMGPYLSQQQPPGRLVVALPEGSLEDSNIILV